MKDFPTPIVRWADNGHRIDLTIELSDVKSPTIKMNPTLLTFEGCGHGAHGENIYSLEIEYYRKIDHELSHYTITDRSIHFILYKQDSHIDWPRLLKSEQKPGWLRIDFDKWKIEDSDKDDEENEMDKVNKVTFETAVKSEIEKAHNDIKVFTKVAWLSIYNGFQTICYFIIFVKLLYAAYEHKGDVLKFFYDDVSDLLLTCQIAAFLEIIHPLVGLVKTGVVAPIMQNFGKSFVLFVLVMPVKEMHQNLVVFIVFLAWSASEVIRYPFYIVTLFHIKIYSIYWLRYSAWIILYPIGMFGEAFIYFKSISISEEKRRWSYPLPNFLNVSFSLAMCCRVLLVVMIPGALYLLKHMFILRQRKIGGRKRLREKQM